MRGEATGASGRRSWLRPAGIRAWTLLALVFVGMMPLFVVLFFNRTLATERLLASEVDEMGRLGEQLAEQLARILGHLVEDFHTLASHPVLADPGSSAELRQAILGEFGRLSNGFEELCLLDERGYVIDASSPSPVPVDMTRWFRAALRGEPALSQPLRRSSGDGLMITAYLPVLAEGEGRAAVVRATLSFDEIGSAVGAAQPHPGGRVVLVDGAGNVLASHDGEGIFGKVALAGRGVATVSGGLVPVRRFTGPAGREVTAVRRPLPVTSGSVGRDWSVIWMEETSRLAQPMLETQRMLAMASLFALVSASVVGYFSARALSQPAARLAAAAERASRGDLGEAIPEAGPREMRQLAGSFNRMLAEIKRHQEHLGDLVEDRSRRLLASREELRRLTIQLQAAYEAVPEGILVMGLDGTVIEANRKLETFFTLPFAELGGRAFDEFYLVMRDCFEDREDFDRRWNHFADHPEESGTDEWVLTSPVQRTINSFTSPVRDADGRPFARLWMFRDITDRRRLERGLQQAQKMEAIGQLAGGVAHDFNNLLTGIEGNLTLLSMDGDTRLGSSGQRSLDLARQACDRAARLVKGLLGYSRRSPLSRERCDPNVVVRDTLALFERTIDPRIAIELRLDPGVPAFDVDAGQVQQIVMNILVNARDAMPEGGELRLSTSAVRRRARPSPGLEAVPGGGDLRRFVCIEVEDTGPGMPSAVRERIFEPFFTTKEQGKGTGLGMAMSYGLARQHAGWIECESEPGAGAVFRVLLPVASVWRADAVPATEARGEGGGSDVTGSGGAEVLVVDDETVVRAVAEGILRHLGHRVTTAANGREAVDACRHRGGTFDVVLLDMTMPVMSGRDALRIIKNEFPDLPVVICSGFSVELNSFEGKPHERPDAIIQKPYAVERLRDVIARVIAREEPRERSRTAASSVEPDPAALFGSGD